MDIVEILFELVKKERTGRKWERKSGCQWLH